MNLDDLVQSGVRVLSGRDEGYLTRKTFDLDYYDTVDDVVFVNIPEYIWSVNSSFFLACFGDSIRKLGEEAFRKKYRFKCEAVIARCVEDGISRALKTSKFPLYPRLYLDVNTKKVIIDAGG
jgi:hypothetical protein